MLLSVLCVLCFCTVLFIVSLHVYSCLFSICVQFCQPLSPGGNPILVNKYVYHYHISYHISYHITYHISYHIIYRIISHIISYHILYHIQEICLLSVFTCFMCISEQTAILYLYNINRLVFITETECVYCAVRTGYLNMILLLLLFLDAFAKLRKATISFMSVFCPSVHIELGSYPSDFHEIWHCNTFRNICYEYSSFIKTRRK